MNSSPDAVNGTEAGGKRTGFPNLWAASGSALGFVLVFVSMRASGTWWPLGTTSLLFGDLGTGLGVFLGLATLAPLTVAVTREKWLEVLIWVGLDVFVLTSLFLFVPLRAARIITMPVPRLALLLIGVAVLVATLPRLSSAAARSDATANITSDTTASEAPDTSTNSSPVELKVSPYHLGTAIVLAGWAFYRAFRHGAHWSVWLLGVFAAVALVMAFLPLDRWKR